MFVDQLYHKCFSGGVYPDSVSIACVSATLFAAYFTLPSDQLCLLSATMVEARLIQVSLSITSGSITILQMLWLMANLLILAYGILRVSSVRIKQKITRLEKCFKGILEGVT